MPHPLCDTICVYVRMLQGLKALHDAEPLSSTKKSLQQNGGHSKLPPTYVRKKSYTPTHI